MTLSACTNALTNLKSYQRLISDCDTQITINPSRPELVVTSSNAALSTIIIPSSVNAPKLNYTMITSGGTVLISNSMIIMKDLDGDTIRDFQLTIPASTTITGTSWNGLLELPTIMSSTSISSPTSQGQVNTPRTVIELGSNIPLSFSNPVRLLFAGQAGLHAGFFHSSPAVTEITSTCTVDSGTGIPADAKE